MQLTTALTDALLASSALAMAGWVWRRPAPGRRLAAVGLGFVGAAAALGTLRFGGLGAIAPVHDALSTLAGGAGVPSVGVGLVALVTGRDRPAAMVGALLGLLGLAAFTAWVVPMEAVRTAVGALGLLGVIAACGWRASAARMPAAAGIAGAVGTLVAGLAVGSEGQWGAVLRVDVFHVLLALSCLGLGLAAGRLPPR